MAQELLFLENAECMCTWTSLRNSASIQCQLTVKAGSEQTSQVSYALVSLHLTAGVLYSAPINYTGFSI